MSAVTTILAFIGLGAAVLYVGLTVSFGAAVLIAVASSREHRRIVRGQGWYAVRLCLFWPYYIARSNDDEVIGRG